MTKKLLFLFAFLLRVSVVSAEECTEGYVPDGKGGCRLPACYDDADCSVDQVCQNGGTAEARCVLKKDGSDCFCPLEHKEAGAKRCYVHKGVCVPSYCEKYDDCPQGHTCVDSGEKGRLCEVCDMDAKAPECNCPSKQLGDGRGRCVTPSCTTTPNDTCSPGTHCVYPDKLAAACEDCTKGTQCTCPLEKVADGEGGCIVGCAYTSQVSCENGIKGCQRCTRDNKCWLCIDCADGYYLDATNNACRVCAENCTLCFSAVNCVECRNDYKLNAEGVCVPKVCTDYNKMFQTDCDIGQKKIETGITAGDGNECFTCVTLTCEDLKMHREKDGEWAEKCVSDGGTVGTDGKCFFCKAGVCPDGYSTETTSCPKYRKLFIDGKANGKPCGRCELMTCREIDSKMRSHCDTSISVPVPADVEGRDGPCFICRPKTCNERNKDYATSCPVGKVAEKLGLSGADGECVTCRDKTCREIDPTYINERKACRKGVKISVGFSAYDGDCFYCDTEE